MSTPICGAPVRVGSLSLTCGIYDGHGDDHAAILFPGPALPPGSALSPGYCVGLPGVPCLLGAGHPGSCSTDPGSAPAPGGKVLCKFPGCSGHPFTAENLVSPAIRAAEAHEAEAESVHFGDGVSGPLCGSGALGAGETLSSDQDAVSCGRCRRALSDAPLVGPGPFACRAFLGSSPAGSWFCSLPAEHDGACSGGLSPIGSSDPAADGAAAVAAEVAAEPGSVRLLAVIRSIEDSLPGAVLDASEEGGFATAGLRSFAARLARVEKALGVAPYSGGAR